MDGTGRSPATVGRGRLATAPRYVWAAAAVVPPAGPPQYRWAAAEPS